MRLCLLYYLFLWAAWAQFLVVKSKDAVEESKSTDFPKTDTSQTNTHQVSSGLMQCGEYSNEVMPNGQCRLIATLPQLEEQRCPDMFRCTDEVSYWLRENEERKQQMQDLKETISELQEELRSHRHRIKVLELQSEEKYGINSSLEHRFHTLQQIYEEANALLHIHGSLIYDMQTQIRNLTMIVERVRRNPGCMINIIRTSPLLSAQDTLHPEVQHVRNCPIDCASLYYNGVHRSGIFTVVPSLGSTPVDVYCDMETQGGGWTMFQRRQDGKVNFNRKWTEYRDGFGDLRAEFWLGNDHIHDISSQGEYSLRIELEDWNGLRTRTTTTVSMYQDSVVQSRTRSVGTTTSKASGLQTQVTSVPRYLTEAGGTISASLPTSMECIIRGGVTLPKGRIFWGLMGLCGTHGRTRITTP
ncbi:angiopoietin-4 isoform X2 [Siphateles boraxobius]|uniref:angiopoietin-4 isoform X2 n=1 Tax=Siphateles boraxobius TaxID=180520 RepID=UPI0040648D71